MSNGKGDNTAARTDLAKWNANFPLGESPRFRTRPLAPTHRRQGLPESPESEYTSAPRGVDDGADGQG